MSCDLIFIFSGQPCPVLDIKLESDVSSLSKMASHIHKRKMFDLTLNKITNSYPETQWSRVLLEKLTICQQVTKFPTFYGTRRFITAFTSAHHLSTS